MLGTSEYVCQLSTEDKAYAAANLNETDEVRPVKIAEIKQWIMENENFQAPTGNYIIESKREFWNGFKFVQSFLFSQTIFLFCVSWERASSTSKRPRKNSKITVGKDRLYQIGMVTGIRLCQNYRNSLI